jgi:hypothetical protein
MKILERIVFLFYLVTVANSKRQSTQDEYRPYSQVDIKNEKYIKQIHENRFPAIVTKHNLELLQLLQQKTDYLKFLKPPEIKITKKMKKLKIVKSIKIEILEGTSIILLIMKNMKN